MYYANLFDVYACTFGVSSRRLTRFDDAGSGDFPGCVVVYTRISGVGASTGWKGSENRRHWIRTYRGVPWIVDRLRVHLAMIYD